MTIQLSNAMLSLLIGVGILIWPKLLNYFIAFWLIIQGLIGLGIIKF
ncbi:DUF3096 domain-containing protein [Candidatus Woesebacteria bacterium]|nr:DUF3096 domain-containing protein [Candidatus Woesebacteria bacterium]